MVSFLDLVTSIRLFSLKIRHGLQFLHVRLSLFLLPMFDPELILFFVSADDYTVLVGTQGWFTHKKKDRILELCMKHQIPLIIYAEGGGGRPGDVDTEGVFVAGLNIPTFMNLARLSATVPLICVVNGNSFAGNAALASVCDVIIATQVSDLLVLSSNVVTDFLCSQLL